MARAQGLRAWGLGLGPRPRVLAQGLGPGPRALGPGPGPWAPDWGPGPRASRATGPGPGARAPGSRGSSAPNISLPIALQGIPVKWEQLFAFVNTLWMIFFAGLVYDSFLLLKCFRSGSGALFLFALG